MENTLEIARHFDSDFDCLEELFSKNVWTQKQPFDFLLVLDFEATCWDKTDFNKGAAEVIEFPCVLYDIKNGKVLEEFQQYVMPQERPNLTPFCIELTGITQNQVNSGVPLNTCLLLFHRWLNEQILKYNITFQSPTSSLCKSCVFATWSDWDLGNCLKNECIRKNIPRNDIFKRWIDIRSLYVEHYQRRPRGLLGALNDVGLQFEGQQHCGLHDARNTARLVQKMIKDGLILRITKDISRKPK